MGPYPKSNDPTHPKSHPHPIRNHPDLSTDPNSHPTAPSSLTTFEETNRPGELMPTALHNLPEPTDLHASLTVERPLDWGAPIATKAEIAAKYGAGAAAESLRRLTKAAAVEDRITAAVISALGADAAPYHLANRLKSPESLARKLVKYADYYRRSNHDPEDVLRYTAAVKHPDEITKAAVRAIERLQNQQWQMESAIHSYVEGSRYKGLHAFLRSQGERIELQVHSGESIDVKEQTTPLYEIERDTKQPRDLRDAARRECIALSDRMAQPAGIDDLVELGGVAVRAVSYGKQSPTHRADQAKPRAGAAGVAQQPTHQPTQDRRNGMGK
ncbi:hypothetical protein ACIBL3_24340 [Kribbella sp. NPDC050124]|uniref:hypothetical protein n=1 Tax=Kribbella sp. NPDC050124 TaxID=3364114 RepID=UPI00379AD92B